MKSSNKNGKFSRIKEMEKVYLVSCRSENRARSAAIGCYVICRLILSVVCTPELGTSISKNKYIHEVPELDD